MELYYQQSIKSCHPIDVSRSDLKEACSSLLPHLLVSDNTEGAYQLPAEELQTGADPSALPVTPEGASGRHPP